MDKNDNTTKEVEQSEIAVKKEVVTDTASERTPCRGQTMMTSGCEKPVALDTAKSAMTSDIQDTSKRPTPVVENGDSEPDPKRQRTDGSKETLQTESTTSGKNNTEKQEEGTTTTVIPPKATTPSPRPTPPATTSSQGNSSGEDLQGSVASQDSNKSHISATVTDSPGSSGAVIDEPTTTLTEAAPPTQPQHATTGSTAPPPPSSPPPPLKSTTMSHLRKKYLTELEYMLREFRKLERQLLGAKGNATGVEESAGSRERREKLHSFILHLEDTIRQIEVGCRLEPEGKSTPGDSAEADGERQPAAADTSSLSKMTKEKEEEENVQKLEEHILANLLPVKVRLKKQLAAQQGATRNPAGMPVTRRGVLQPPVDKGKGTFVAAAEQKRKQAEAALAAQQRQKELAEIAAPQDDDDDDDESQFGKPLSGGASSLTQKLHGATLGSGEKLESEPEPTMSTTNPLVEASPTKRKVFYAGMTPGSEQQQSGVSAAAGAHNMIIETPSLLTKEKGPVNPTHGRGVATTTPEVAQVTSASVRMPPHPGQAVKAKLIVGAKLSGKSHLDPSLPEEERRRLRKLRRRRKKRRDARRREKERQRKLFLQNQQKTMKKGGKIVMKAFGKRKGPRTVEYICALCSEVYNSACEFNPWWALASHECPKCRKNQIPRVDITSPSNAIEYHPALLVNADDPNAVAAAAAVAADTGSMHLNPSHITNPNHPFGPRNQATNPALKQFSDSESDLSELSDDPLSDGSEYSGDSADEVALSPAEQAENENFGKNYDGPRLTPDHASRLLVMMGHASTCPGRHKSVKHRDVCSSVKFLMLHVRDCPGTTSTYDICPFPWCRKVKHLLYHLVACPRPKDCAICSPIGLSPNLENLIGLNEHRRAKHRERMRAAMAAAAAKARAVPPKVGAYKSKGGAYKPVVSHKRTHQPAYKPIVHPKPPQALHVRPKPTGTTIRPGAKSSNGVIVKTLVKPPNKTHVTIKSSVMGTKSGTTKIDSNGLIGPPRKATFASVANPHTNRTSPGQTKTTSGTTSQARPTVTTQTIAGPQQPKLGVSTLTSVRASGPGTAAATSRATPKVASGASGPAVSSTTAKATSLSPDDDEKPISHSTTTQQTKRTELGTPPLPATANLPNMKVSNAQADDAKDATAKEQVVIVKTEVVIKSETERGDDSAHASDTSIDPPSLGALPIPKPSVTDLLAPPSPSDLGPAIMTPPRLNDSPTEASTTLTATE